MATRVTIDNDDDAIVEALNALITDMRYDDALELNIRTYEEALANDQYRLIAFSLYYFGLIEERQGDPQKAMAFYKKSTIIGRKYDVHDCLVRTLNSRGNLYIFSGKMHNAISKYMEALSIIEKNPQVKSSKERILNNLGILYLEINDFDKAIKYLFECIQLAKESGNEILLSTAYSNITEIYLKKETFLKAKYYNKLSEQISKRIGDKVGIALAMANEAIILHGDKGDFHEVRALFEKSIALIKPLDSEVDKDQIVIKFATEAFSAREYELAITMLTELISESRAKTYHNIEVNALEILEKIYVRLNDYINAHGVITRILEIKESAYTQWKTISLDKMDKEVKDQEEFGQITELQKSIKTLKILSEIGQKITACTERTQMFDILVEHSDRIFNFDAFGVGFKEKNSQMISYKYYDKGETEEIQVSAMEEDYLMVQCIKKGEDIIIYDSKDDNYNDSHFSGRLQEIVKNSNNRAIIFCPITFESHTIGGITIQSEKKGQFTYLDLESLRVLATYVAIAFTNLNRAKELIVANGKLEEASMKDGLTKTLNRHALGQYIGKEFIGLLESKLPATALMIDIDYFKQYNDNYGHVMGDKCLKGISNALRSSLKKYKHKLFRYGGDEFFVVIENCDREKCEKLLKSIAYEVKSLNIFHSHSKVSEYVTLTIGACVIMSRILDYTEVFTNADEALYVAKDNGRNGYYINMIQNT